MQVAAADLRQADDLLPPHADATVIREILIISTPQDTRRLEQMLCNGSRWRLKLEYAMQPSPDGLAHLHGHHVALTKFPVRSDVAMTCEITFRCEVLSIGGWKEKLLAASRGVVKKGLMPVDEKDFVEIPDNIKGNLDIRPVKWIDQLLEHALVRQPIPLPAARRRPGRSQAGAAAGGLAGPSVRTSFRDLKLVQRGAKS